MYGLVNQGVKDLVISNFGEESWKALAKEAESPDDFVAMQYYDDGLTYRLVGAASKMLNQPPEKILSEFGRHWVHFTGKEGYGPIMDLFGGDFKSCLENLNHLHTRMGMTLPHLKPPSFAFSEIDSKTYELKYTSERLGLSPMVIGLIDGLAKKYNVQVRIEECSFEASTKTQIFRINLMG